MLETHDVKQVMADRGLFTTGAALSAFLRLSLSATNGDPVRFAFIELFREQGTLGKQLLNHTAASEVMEIAVAMFRPFAPGCIRVFLELGAHPIRSQQVHGCISACGMITGFLRAFYHIKDDPQRVEVYSAALCELVVELAFHGHWVDGEYDEMPKALPEAIVGFYKQVVEGPNPTAGRACVYGMLEKIVHGMQRGHKKLSSFGEVLVTNFAYQMFKDTWIPGKALAITNAPFHLLFPPPEEQR